jgi:hypothetical protein
VVCDRGIGPQVLEDSLRHVLGRLGTSSGRRGCHGRRGYRRIGAPIAVICTDLLTARPSTGPLSDRLTAPTQVRFSMRQPTRSPARRKARSASARSSAAW